MQIAGFSDTAMSEISRWKTWWPDQTISQSGLGLVTLKTISSLLRSAAMIALASHLFLAVPATAQVCQDGLNCRCDLLVEQHGDSIVFCEDFENERLGDRGVWQKNPSSLQGAGWRDQGYQGISLGCGFPLPGSNGTRMDGQADITNTGKCIDITSSNPASLTIEGVPGQDRVFDGNYSLAALNQPPVGQFSPGVPDYQPGGKHGTASLDRPVKNFGITRATYVSANVAQNGAAWKNDQFTAKDLGFYGTVNTINPDSDSPECVDTQQSGWNWYPYAGTGWFSARGDTETWTDVVGHGCKANKLKIYPSAEYRHKPATWRCMQIQYEGWGTTSGRIRHWWDGELVLDLQNVNMSSMQSQINPNGLDQFSFNNYFNGATGNQSNQGYMGNSISGRLKDNIVIREGAPVSCEEIGFDFEGDASGGGVSQNQRPPLPPILLMPE